MGDPCAFCEIVAGNAPAQILHEWRKAIAITPLSPVTEGHELIISKEHVANALEWPALTGDVMQCAAERAWADCNLITSIGTAATQTVFHLHVHIVPRRPGDGLRLPWPRPSEEPTDA